MHSPLLQSPDYTGVVVPDRPIPSPDYSHVVVPPITLAQWRPAVTNRRRARAAASGTSHALACSLQSSPQLRGGKPPAPLSLPLPRFMTAPLSLLRIQMVGAIYLSIMPHQVIRNAANPLIEVATEMRDYMGAIAPLEDPTRESPIGFRPPKLSTRPYDLSEPSPLLEEPKLERHA